MLIMDRLPPPRLCDSGQNQIGKSTLKDRKIGLDIMRIYLAFLIFLFHSKVHLDCDYGFFNDFVMASCQFAMTGFFILSGYSIQTGYGKKRLLEPNSLGKFLKKRFVSIYPLYIVTGTIKVLLYIIVGLQSFYDNLVLLPVEVLGIQSWFEGSLFQYAHNGGSWFISCLLLCYFLYPYLQIYVNKLPLKGTCCSILILLFLLSYSPSICIRFEINGLYTNPLFRLLEFILGLLLVNLNSMEEKGMKLLGIIKTRYFALAVFLIVFICEVFSFGINKTLLNLCCICFLCLFFGFSSFKICPNAIKNTLMFLSGISYSFYLGQAFVWYFFKLLRGSMGIELSNIFLIIVSLILCVVVAILLHNAIEIKFGNYLKKRLAII